MIAQTYKDMHADEPTKSGKAIRIPDAPEWLHERIERHMALRRVKGEKLTKAEACIELLDKATSKIK